MNLKHILCPFDFSPSSEAALALASSLARDNDAALHLVHVYAEPFAYTDESSDVPPADLKAEQERWEQTQPTIRGVSCRREFLVGPPVATLLDYANSHNIDLIVMGTHGRTGVTRLLMGSVAEAVVRRRQLSRDDGQAASGVSARHERHFDIRSQKVDIKNILCPVDFSTASVAALQLGSALAREHGATIFIVYVEPNTEALGPLGTIDLNSLEHHELWHTLPLATDVTFEQRLLFGDPADEILQFAESNKVDLIVMGSHGRTGLARMLTGSVAEAVIRRATVPVLTVKQPSPLSAPVAK